MQISINKTKLTAIIIMALLTTSAFMLIINLPVQAQQYTNVQDSGSVPLPSGVTPDYTLDLTPYLSFRPNPIGLNQIFLSLIHI